ncbi:class I SAM-dependent methyltransferase [Synechocystis sp. PCC 7509]|uniref:class I SAM-dependent methyltransferase n=1 Tax=Synechocystis sp. PCC 7509 TaxID=927677 RepID=UPI0002AC6165|nr:class I SAM-dependent methyltransferase [Synechocystis sp. PCC 7509]
MKTISNKPEYHYGNSNAGHHHAYLLSPLLAMLRENTIANQKLRILDLGCGNGSLSNSIAQQGYEVVGVEESESGFKFASSSFPNCHFIQSSIYNLPYQQLANAFDVVIASEVIEHLFYPSELVRAAKKCLKPNGRLILTTPYHGYLKNIVLAISGKMDKHFTTLVDGGHIKFFSVKTLSNLLEAESLSDINFQFAGRFPYLWKSMLCSSSPVSMSKNIE